MQSTPIEVRHLDLVQVEREGYSNRLATFTSLALLMRICKRQKEGHEGEKVAGACTQEEMRRAPSPTHHSSLHGANCSPSAKSISSTFLPQNLKLALSHSMSSD